MRLQVVWEAAKADENCIATVEIGIMGRMSEPTPLRLSAHHTYKSFTTTWWDAQGHRRTKRFGREGEVTRREADARYSDWLRNEFAPKAHVRNPSDPNAITVAKLACDYEEYAKKVFVKRDAPTGHMSNVHYGIAALKEHYGDLPLAEIDYPKISKLRHLMCVGAAGGALSIKTVNGRLACIKAAFLWGRDQGHVSAVILNDVMMVKSLISGRCEARDSKSILPVDRSAIDRAKKFLPPTVRAMVDLQLLMGMRPGEVCIMRPCDFTGMSDDVWVYEPEYHKTERKGKTRQIPIGPRAQAILKPILPARPDEYIFSPARAQAERRTMMAAERSTPMSCGNVAGSNRKANPKTTPGAVYNCQSYRKAIRYACLRAAIPIWHPNQLRHTAGTNTREKYGYEAAVDLLGHSAPSTSAIYAERSLSRSKDISRKSG
jgi:integrase